MKIDRKLNLVIPLERDDGSVIYAHSSPISREVFEAHFLVIAKTFNTIIAEGLSRISGPRISALTLKMIAEKMGIWEGQSGVKNGLINEMHRLTAIFAPGANGWETIPFPEAVKTGVIDEDEASEVENALVFFSCAYRMWRKQVWPEMLIPCLELWGGQITSSNATEYRTSLPTLTQVENTGANQTADQLSVPV